MKNTKLTELQIEVEVLEEECRYLQRIFKDMMNDCDETQNKGLNELEEKYYKQKNLIAYLDSDNKEMEIQLKILDEQNKAYQEEIARYEESIRQNEDELDEQKAQMRFKDIQIKNLRREASDTKVGSTEQYIRNELEVKINEYQELEKKLNEVRKEESTQEKAAQEAEQSYSTEKDKEIMEKAILMKELERLRNLNPNLDSDDEEQDLDEAHTNRVKESTDLIIPVNVVRLAQLVTMRLKALRRSYYDLQEQLFGHDSLDNGQVSFEIVLRNLQRTPFLLKNDEAILVNNCLKDILKKSEDGELVPINLMNVAIRKIIGEYDTYTEHDEISVERTIHKKYFKDREIGLKDEFKKLVL